MTMTMISLTSYAIDFSILMFDYESNYKNEIYNYDQFKSYIEYLLSAKQEMM